MSKDRLAELFGKLIDDLIDDAKARIRELRRQDDTAQEQLYRLRAMQRVLLKELAEEDIEESQKP